MKIKIFDVVELNNQNKATILSMNNGNYMAEIVNREGISQGTSCITEKDIKKVVFAK